MIVSKQHRQTVIDLTGPNGNAYYLLAQAESMARQLDLNSAMILHQMRAEDYENLVQVFDRYFGDYVILER
jgi:hypothetical protein